MASQAEVASFQLQVRESGAYGWLTTSDEVYEVRASAARERAIFVREKVRALEEWLAWADERLAGQPVVALIMPGNDDPPEIDAVLATSNRLRNVQGEAIELAAGLWLASRGESTPTPWQTPRELPDDELGSRIAEVTDLIPSGAAAIWNMHMPPYSTTVDLAPKLGPDLRVEYDGSGEPIMVPVGSRALRRLIEERQPALALHGHIHESRGRYRLGRTSGFNPGSRYEDGVLMGVLLRVSARRGLRSWTFTSG